MTKHYSTSTESQALDLEQAHRVCGAKPVPHRVQQRNTYNAKPTVKSKIL